VWSFVREHQCLKFVVYRRQKSSPMMATGRHSHTSQSRDVDFLFVCQVLFWMGSLRNNRNITWAAYALIYSIMHLKPPRTCPLLFSRINCELMRQVDEM
jgi:hypothetical protein